MRTAIGCLLLATACSGGKDETDGSNTILPPPDTETDSGTEPTTDTETGGYFVDATYFAVSARFGFDPETQTHVLFAEPGEGFSPLQLSIVLIDSSIAVDGVLDDRNSCEVTLEIDDPQPIAPWVAANGAWIGFDVPADARVDDRCVNYGLPGDFQGDAAAVVSKWRWSVGVGPLADDVRKTLQATLPPSEWDSLEPLLVGAAADSDVFQVAFGASFSDDGIAIANEVDGNFEIVVGGTGNPKPIPADQVPLETGGATRGYYEVSMGPFASTSLLAEPPGL